MDKAIGVIDSGVGGLTVVREIMRQLPQERVFYFGDTARCPYGPRSTDEVRTFTLQMVSYLLRQKIKALVIACNTATAVVFDEIMQHAPIPVIGVIDPGARTAIKETKSGVIGVIGTVGTIRSRAYEKALKRIAPDVEVYSYACPDFVPLVESGIPDPAAALEIVKNSLQPLTTTSIDTLILGCTHYPLLADVIAQVMGKEVKLINSAKETARELSSVLHYRKLFTENSENVPPTHKFFVSGSSSVMKVIAQSFLHVPLDLQQVDVSNEKVCTISWTKT
ncbi:glutamate racemase [Ammoniphilus sp. CFH 90114]|uniref:glutamate racemase n=1 Tax=Ammoniphilus sp. CFH 90114 TaxID=2493665 RepID=UPI00100E8E7F|nr:glutamate racemase [Ammoniphilus sp. CFH 90114]RXT14668.1 glutamate racemase [Ammoniphilus sp. CFH 90114]